MIKGIALIKRKAGMSKEDFFAYWEKVHGQLTIGPKTPPVIKRYTQTHWLTLPDGREADFDGIAEMWFETADDARAFREFVASDAGSEVRNDTVNFMDLGCIAMYAGEEKVIKG